MERGGKSPFCERGRKSRFSGHIRTEPDILGDWTSRRWVPGRDWPGACGLPCQVFWTMNIVCLSGCPGLALPSGRVLSAGQTRWYMRSITFASSVCQGRLFQVTLPFGDCPTDSRPRLTVRQHAFECWLSSLTTVFAAAYARLHKREGCELNHGIRCSQFEEMSRETRYETTHV